jgi:hypothetical protein
MILRDEFVSVDWCDVFAGNGAHDPVRRMKPKIKLTE